MVKPPRFSTFSQPPAHQGLPPHDHLNQINSGFAPSSRHSPHAFPGGPLNNVVYPPPHVPPPRMAPQQYPVISASSAFLGIVPIPDPQQLPYTTWVPPPALSAATSSSSASWSPGSSIVATPSTSVSSLGSPHIDTTPLAAASSKSKLSPVSPPASPPPPAYTLTSPTSARPPLVATTSAPEVRPPPLPVVIPDRSATAPVPDASANLSQPSGNSSQPSSKFVAQAAEARHARSRKPSVAAAPKDLDKIDELDESDPLGLAWHHGGPYEAIKKSVEKDPKLDSSTKVRPFPDFLGIVPSDWCHGRRTTKIRHYNSRDLGRRLVNFSVEGLRRDFEAYCSCSLTGSTRHLV